MPPVFTASRTSISLLGTAIPGAEDRQKQIPGFDQEVFSRSNVLCIGAGGLISHIAPTLVRKGIGRLTILDDDTVEPCNLNRQRFYPKDIGQNKAVALIQNLQSECIAETELRGYAFPFEETVALGLSTRCDVAICGVDNNPARVAVSRYFRSRGTPVVFTAVSRDGDHGYVFVQETAGACIACLFPDIVNDDRFPCPGTPAIADILQIVGGIAVYAVDTLLMSRPRAWQYRRLGLAEGLFDSARSILPRDGCLMCAVLTKVFPTNRRPPICSK